MSRLAHWLQFSAFLSLLQLFWFIRRHRARLIGFKFPAKQSRGTRALIDVLLTIVVSSGEALIGLARPKLLFRIAHAYTRKARILDAAYGPHPFHRADVFVPSVATPSSLPVIVFIRGGAWAWGSRFAYSSFCERLAHATRAAVVNVDYRVYPHGNACDMVADVVCSLSWVRRCADQWGCNKDSIHLFGHSAGAHLVMQSAVLLARAATVGSSHALPSSGADAGWAPEERCRHQCALPARFTAGEAREVLAALRSCVGFAGVYSIADHYEHEASRVFHAGAMRVALDAARISPMYPAMGGPDDFDAHSPTLGVGGLSAAQAAVMPRVLLVHGSSDDVVPCRSSQRLRDACVLGGVSCSLHAVPGMDHATGLLEIMEAGSDDDVGVWGNCVLATVRSAVEGVSIEERGEEGDPGSSTAAMAIAAAAVEAAGKSGGGLFGVEL